MRRTGLILVTIALAFAGVTGCSSGDDKYCGLLKDAQNDKTLQGANFKDAKAMETARTKFKEISDAAPSDVQDEWKTMSELLDMADKYQKDPKSVDAKKVQSLSKQVETDTKTLETDTKDRCGIDLNATS
ncbi:hypothetical protein [Flindersiella endophytica]